MGMFRAGSFSEPHNDDRGGIIPSSLPKHDTERRTDNTGQA